VADEPTPCSEGGAPRPAGNLARQVDDAGINALLVAVELRADMPTGEPGELMTPGGFRSMLREILTDDLAAPLGCALDVDALDRVVLLAHSGGYQAAAAALEYGDVTRVTEVALLDALYGAEDSFSRWFGGQLRRFDGEVAEPLRFVDLYTCCGGTAERSRGMARFAANALSHDGLSRSLYDDDGPGEPDADALAHPVVIKRVAAAHGDLPREYVRALLGAAGFARVGGRASQSQ
jgi:pimeloyl-ACP methyl ester carboxylesterase